MAKAVKTKKKRKTIDDHFYFHDVNEFIIFLVWGLLVTTLLLSFI